MTDQIQLAAQVTEDTWDWAGARWWKFDLHAHSPASSDYGRGQEQARLMSRSAREWLLDFMRARIDCVVITDHNTGNWIDRLTSELHILAADPPSEYRRLWLFPGVEISVNGGVHILAILPLDSTTGAIDTMLGSVGYRGIKGDCDSVTTRSLPEVLHEINNAGGIAVPAHVDGPDGLFTTVHGTTLQATLSSPQVFSMEVSSDGFTAPAQYRSLNRAWTEVVGSDSHHPSGISGQSYPGSRFTWIKMGEPSLDGLRLALLDGKMSVRTVYRESGLNPNSHPAQVIEAIEIRSSRYMGRSAPFVVTFNPWMNALVGGRGVGKSTIVEFMRLALQRSSEVLDELTQDFDKYRRVYPNRDDPGLLTPDSRIEITYRKAGTRYRVTWVPGRTAPAIREAHENSWREVEGDVQQRFPARIYIQKQIFHLANAPLALLATVDDAPEADHHAWSQRWHELVSHRLVLLARARELEAQSAEDSRLRGELDDVGQRIAVFDRSNHADVLKSYETARRRDRLIDAWEARWSGASSVLRNAAGSLEAPLLEETLPAEESLEPSFVRQAAAPILELRRVATAAQALAQEADQVAGEWRDARAASPLAEAAASARAQFETLVQLLAQEGAGDITGYAALLQRRQQIEDRLSLLQQRRTEAEALLLEAQDVLHTIVLHRQELTTKRAAFLRAALEDNQYVRVRVVPYGAMELVEAQIRSALQLDDTAFTHDIGAPGGAVRTEGLLGALYERADSSSVESALMTLKARTRAIASGQVAASELRDARFAAYLARLEPEVFDRLDVWFPEDSLEVEYSTTSDGSKFRAIQEGSPGQKTAALLAFLLSYGDEPLVLDQPEDDLDNRLIYELIVTQLRQAKSRRQVIVVTHNANIVVNGDAEYVAALVARGGESHIDPAGSLQDGTVREMICEVMEGGREAFEQRYRRISLAGRNV